MKNFAFTLTALLTLSIISASAFAAPNATGNYDKHLINYGNLSEQIYDQLEASGLAEALKLDENASITFLVDEQHRLVLIDVSAEDFDLIRDLKAELRGLELSVDENQVGKTYRLAIEFDIAG